MENSMNRKGFIGGSDCTQIMQGNWLKLWQIKTGRAESEDLSRNLAVQMGIHTEDFNLSWFEAERNVTVRGQQTEFKADVGGVPVVGTVDGLVDRCIVECKHTNAYNTMNKVSDYYMPQLQTYMHIADADGAYLSVIFGNSEWDSVHVARNEEYFNSMWAVVSDFWGYVVRDEEPIGIDTPTLSTERIPLDEMVVRDASRDNEFMDAAITFVNGYEHNRVFENAKKNLKQMVADNEREVYCDHLTIKRDKRGALRITKR
jgi:hypothetical protein